MAARGLGTGYQGSKWITRKKRLAIYLRDGLACAYCGATIEDGAMLTLDHIIPHCEGGSNAETNLVTACRKCNSSRANRTVEGFAGAIANYLNRGTTAEMILAHISATTGKNLFIPAAMAIIAARGTWQAALRN